MRWWIAGIGGGAGVVGAGIVIMQGKVGTVPGIVCLVLGACAVVAAVFGLRDSDLGGWAATFIALVLGIATFVACLVAAGRDRHEPSPLLIGAIAGWCRSRRCTA